MNANSLNHNVYVVDIIVVTLGFGITTWSELMFIKIITEYFVFIQVLTINT